MRTSNSWRFLGCRGKWVVVAAALFAVCAVRGQPEDESPAERNSPEERLPSLMSSGLSNLRAIPRLESPDNMDSGYVPLYRLTRPYYDTIFATVPPQYLPPPDPTSFRTVVGYEQPLGLQPRRYRTGLLELYPFAGLAQSYDSNVNLTPTDPISDFYVSPRAGLELQLGTPDSAWSEGYDSIVALNSSYEGWGDIFYENPNLSAYNQKFNLTTRIGRSSAIWRPFLYFSDITGTDLITTELTNRTKRIRLSTGVIGQYQLTPMVNWNQSFSYFKFNHPDPDYVNLYNFQTRQDFGYRVLHETFALLWAGYRYTDPSRGASANEYFIGTGWRGKPDPRLYTEMHVGYGWPDLNGAPSGVSNMAGARFNGYTTFQWSPRFAFTLIYDRDYIFNEQGTNDNYVSTLLQFKGEFFLGDNWYVTPYFGWSLNEFQLSDALSLQMRPELEISYALPSDTEANRTRVYVKFGYSHSENIQGEGAPIDGFRTSLGFTWKY